ncbi:MAG: transporter [Phenylobacterium sp.]
MRILLLSLAAALLAGSAHAQALRDFCAERPGKATPPCIVDKGHLMIETGLADAVFVRGAAHADTYTLGATELRLGVSRRVEIGADWTPLSIDHERGEPSRTGVGDAVFDVKAALTDPDADGLAVSAQAFVTAPTATNGQGAGGWTGGLRLPIASALSADTDVDVTPELDLVRDSDGHGTHLAWTAAAGISHSFGPTTLGAEVWGMVDDDPADRTYQASVDFTAARMVGDNAQLDAGVNLGLNRTTPDVEIYAGIARRF